MGKLIIIIILISIVYVVLGKAMNTFFDNNKWALWIISIAVALLGVRFLTSSLIYTIILPNSTFAVAIAAGLPFVLYFYMVKDLKPVIYQRIAWIFFGVIFLGLYSLRASDLGSAAFIYPLTAILSFIMAAMSGIISGWFINAKIARMGATYKGSAAAGIKAKLNKAHADYEANPGSYVGGLHTTKSAGKTSIDAYILDMEELESQLAKLLK